MTSIEPASATPQRLDAPGNSAVDRNIFRFLDLYAELRNKIYDLLIVDTDGSDHTDNPAFEEPFNRRPWIPTITGNLNNSSVILYSLDRKILKLNRQIYEEATNYAYNSAYEWVVVAINIRNYSSKLREAGFPVNFRINGSKIPKPLFKLEVIIKNATQAKAFDEFVVHRTYMIHLARAIWLTSGLNLMNITFTTTVFDDTPVKAGTQHKLYYSISSLSHIRGVKEVSFVGFPQNDTAFSILSRAKRTMKHEHDRPREIFVAIDGMLDAGLRCVNVGDLVYAEYCLLSALGHAVDCMKRARIMCMFTTEISTDGKLYSIAEFLKLCTKIQLELANVRVSLGKHKLIPKYANTVLNAWTEGMVRKLSALFMRGKAYSVLGKYEQAVRDLDCTRKIFASLTGTVADEFTFGAKNIQDELDNVTGALSDAAPGSGITLESIRWDIAEGKIYPGLDGKQDSHFAYVVRCIAARRAYQT